VYFLLPPMSEKRKTHPGDEEELLQGTRVTDAAVEQQQQLVLAKKPRTEEQLAGQLVAVQPNAGAIIRAADGTPNQAPPRTSSLQAATLQLTGHAAPIYAARFNATGSQLASAGGDKLVFLWDLAGGECKNSMVLTGHDGPVLDLAWTSGSDLSTEQQLLSCSTDKTTCLWDVQTGQRVKRMRGHGGIVNSVCVQRRGAQHVLTGSDDCTANVWDLRVRRPVQTLQEKYQILSAVFSDDGMRAFTAGISNFIQCYDLRTSRLLYSLVGHRDSVTGLSLSPDGSFLLSNAMDSTVRAWDVRPFVPTPAAASSSAGPSVDLRLTNVYKGATHDLEQNLLRCAWSPDGLRVAAGSADKTLNIWEAATGKLLYRLPGHKGAVTAVEFHPNPAEPVVVSASTDKTLFIGEMS